MQVAAAVVVATVAVVAAAVAAVGVYDEDGIQWWWRGGVQWRRGGIQWRQQCLTATAVGAAVLSQSLIGLRAAMSLALPARRCYQSSRD